MYSDLKMAFFSQLGRRTHMEVKGLFSLPQFSFLSYRSENWDVHEKIRGTFYFLFQKEMETFFFGGGKTRGVETAHFYGTERKKKISS